MKSKYFEFRWFGKTICIRVQWWRKPKKRNFVFLDEGEPWYEITEEDLANIYDE